MLMVPSLQDCIRCLHTLLNQATMSGDAFISSSRRDFDECPRSHACVSFGHSQVVNSAVRVSGQVIRHGKSSQTARKGVP